MFRSVEASPLIEMDKIDDEDLNCVAGVSCEGTYRQMAILCSRCMWHGMVLWYRTRTMTMMILMICGNKTLKRQRNTLQSHVIRSDWNRLEPMAICVNAKMMRNSEEYQTSPCSYTTGSNGGPGHRQAMMMLCCYQFEEIRWLLWCCRCCRHRLYIFDVCLSTYTLANETTRLSSTPNEIIKCRALFE